MKTNFQKVKYSSTTLPANPNFEVNDKNLFKSLWNYSDLPKNSAKIEYKQ